MFHINVFKLAMYSKKSARTIEYTLLRDNRVFIDMSRIDSSIQSTDDQNINSPIRVGPYCSRKRYAPRN